MSSKRNVKKKGYESADPIWERLFLEIDNLKKEGFHRHVVEIGWKFDINTKLLRQKYCRRNKKLEKINKRLEDKNQKEREDFEVYQKNDNIYDSKYIYNIFSMYQIRITNCIKIEVILHGQISIISENNKYKYSYLFIDQNNEIKPELLDIKDSHKGIEENERNTNEEKSMIKKKINEKKYKDKRGGHNKFFSNEQEKELYDYVKREFIETSLFIDDYCLGRLALKKSEKIYKDKKIAFKASNGWIHEFKKRWKLSTLKARYTKIAKTATKDEINDFYKMCKQETEGIDRKYIYNMDETYWRTVFANPYVLGITGSECRPVKTYINPKSGFTAVFIISADGTFHKPLIIMKGRTPLCLKKIEMINDNDVHKKNSLKGWINESNMIFILDEINKNSEGNKSVLILDKYPTHMTDEIKEYAKKLQIKLIYVPAGQTSKNQPLDVSINGPIKSIARKIIKDFYLSNQSVNSLLKQSIDALILSKNKLSKNVVINSFRRACKIEELKN